jgi:hypothetical protein
MAHSAACNRDSARCCVSGRTACKKGGFPVGRKHGGYVFHNTPHTSVTDLVIRASQRTRR